MKTSTFLTKTLFFLTVITASFSSLKAQDSAKKDNKATEIKEMVEGRNYTFLAQTALPLRGRVVQLTSNYDIKVKGDTVITYLPYFGRAYSAPMDPTQSGIQFTSTDFTYTSTERKKGGWDISIKPKDTKDVRELSINISENGYGSVQVTSNNRQSISFNGYLKSKN